MSKSLQHIINKLRSEGKDYSNFKELLDTIRKSNCDISKDDILEFLANDFRIQLHSTPNSIAKLIATISKSNNPNNAIDICCGTGNILYYLQNEIDDITGVEIVENVAELTKYFNPDLHIITADSFKYPFVKKYDLVVGNIPFGMRIELDGKRLPAEEAFLRKAHELLTDNGLVVMLVPYSVLFNSQSQNLRNYFIKYLQEIITLPTGAIRSTHIKTALIVISKRTTKDVKVIQLQQFENLDKEYQGAVPTSFTKKQLIEKWDPKYHLTREGDFYKGLDSFRTEELKDLAEIINGKRIPAETLQKKGVFLYLKPIHIQEDHLNLENSLKYVNKESLNERDFRYILQPGDIVISTIFHSLKMYVYQANDIPAIASNNLAIIRSAKQDYILSYLQTNEGRHVFKTQAEDLRNGGIIPYLSRKDLTSIKIPILPIADLNTLGDTRISRSTEAQLRDALDQLAEYKEKIKALEKEKENSTNYKAFFNNRFERIENQLEIVNKKLDDILSVLKDLKNDFEQIQKLPREQEEKMYKLYQKIDAKLDCVYEKEQETIKNYIEEIKRWLDLWDLLDLQSQKFLPIAEFIYDELSRIEDADFAPFVVQYCRTLENEILKKLFETYHNTGLCDVDRDELVKSDLENQKTCKFARMVVRNKITYTLGEMNFIMALLKQGGNTLSVSPLLRHFRDFVVAYFDEKIVEADFLNDVEKLTSEFRNKAAHPYSMGVDLAQECQFLLRKSLNVFLESVKVKEE